MFRSFFTVFSFFICVNTALISPRLIVRDVPSSIAPALSLPSCAIPCINQAVLSKTTCGAIDLACQCDSENFSLIQGAATSCVLRFCGMQKALQVLADAIAQCSSVLSSSPGTATATPVSAAPSVVVSPAPISALVGTSAVQSSVLTDSSIGFSLPSATPALAFASGVASDVPSSIPDPSPGDTFVVPDCAVNCIQNAIGFTSCALTNLTCQCDPHNSGVIQSATANCVVSSCGDNEDQIAVDVQRSQAANCAALSPIAGSGALSPVITGSVTPNGPTQISLTGCGPPIPAYAAPTYYGYPPGSNPTHPSVSSPTSDSGDLPPSIPTNPSSTSSNNINVDPTGSSGSTPTDPSSSVPIDGSDPLGNSLNSTTPADPSSSEPSDGSFPSSGPTDPTDPTDPSSTATSGSSFPSGGSTDPTDPSSTATSGSSFPSGGSTDPTDPSSTATSRSSFPSGGPTDPTDPSSPATSGVSFPSGGFSTPTDLPGDHSSPSSTIPSGGWDNNGGGPGYGYGGYYPSSTPTGSHSSNSLGGISVSSSATGPASSSGPSDGLPSTSGGDSSSITIGGDPSSPSTTGGDSTSPSSSEEDPSLPSTTISDPSFPSSSGGDPSFPITTGGNPSLPSTTISNPSFPSSSGGDPSLPSTTISDPSFPSTITGDSSSPRTTNGDPSSPTNSGGLGSPSVSPSGTDPSSPSSTKYSPSYPPGYYGYGPPPAAASSTPPSTPIIPPSPSSPPLQSSPPFRLTLLPSNYSLLTYIMRVYFGLCPSPPYISSTGTTTTDRNSACTFTISQPGGLLSCSDPSARDSEEAKYFGDKFSSVWDWGYTVLSTENQRDDLWDKDLNGSFVVDTMSEFPYANLLRLVNDEFIGTDNQARFCTQTTPSTSSSGAQTDAFLEGSPVRAYINGTQELPADCKNVKLVIEWIDNDGIGDTPGYA